MKFPFGKKSDPKAAAAQRRLREATLMQEERGHVLSSSSDFFIREAYKTLRTNVSFALANEEGSSVVLVTSSLQSEGKSITAVNLAISYAQTEKKVVIVDCDLRRPKLARLLQTTSTVGLSNLLMGSKVSDLAIVPSKIKNLDILPAGDIPPNPSELLTGVRMQRLLEELKTRYDIIVLDTPPINMVTDAVALAPQTDGALFVVRANQSEHAAVGHAVDQLEYAKAKLLGFVLNGMDLENTSYGYGKYRYKRYGYRRYGYGKYGYGYRKYGYHRHGYGYGYGYGYSSRQSQKETAE